MSPSTARSYTITTSTTYILRPGQSTVTIAPPRKPPSSSQQSATKPTNRQSQPAYDTITIEPPKKLPTGKTQQAKKNVSQSQPTKTCQQKKKEPAIKDSTIINSSTVKDPTAINSPTVNTQQFKRHLGDLRIIRIPCGSSPNHTVIIPLTSKGRPGFGPEERVAIEDWLGNFPNMRGQDPNTFSFERRLLLGIPAQYLGGDDDYYLYCCQEQEANLPVNEYLSGLSGAYMYGDAFFFKTRAINENGEPKFRGMKPGSEKERNILQKLLTYDLKARRT